MQSVADFEIEINSILDVRPHVSASKINTLVKLATKFTRHYKIIVQAIESFLEACGPEYKLSGIYVVDAIVKAISKQSNEADALIELIEERLSTMFQHAASAPPKDKERLIRVLSLWRRGAPIFSLSTVDELEKTYFTENFAENAAKSTLSTSINVPHNARDPRLNTSTDKAEPESVALIKTLASLIQLQQSAPSAETLSAITTLLPILQKCETTSAADQAIVAQMTEVINAGALNPPNKYLAVDTISNTLGESTSALNAYRNDRDRDDYRSVSPRDSYQGNQADRNSHRDEEYASNNRLDRDRENSNNNQHDRFNPNHSRNDHSNRDQDGGMQGSNQNIGRSFRDQEHRFDQNRDMQDGRYRAPSQQHEFGGNRGGFSQNNGMQRNEYNRQGMNGRRGSVEEDIPPGPECVPAYFDPSIPEGCIKGTNHDKTPKNPVKSRTVYIGGITNLVTTEKLRALFEPYGRVESVRINYTKFNSFVKMYSRAEAENANQNLQGACIDDSISLKCSWSAGFGPKEGFDNRIGESLIQISSMREQEKRWVSVTKRGGGPLESGMVMEEPDVILGPKRDSTIGNPMDAAVSNMTSHRGMRGRGYSGDRGGYMQRGGFGQRGGYGQQFNQQQGFQHQMPFNNQHMPFNNQQMPFANQQPSFGNQPNMNQPFMGQHHNQQYSNQNNRNMNMQQNQMHQGYQHQEAPVSQFAQIPGLTTKPLAITTPPLVTSLPDQSNEAQQQYERPVYQAVPAINSSGALGFPPGLASMDNESEPDMKRVRRE